MRVAAWIFVVLLVLLLGAAAVPWGLRRLTEDTEYAPGFSEAGFESIAVGDDRARVLAVLGAPLEARSVKRSSSWLYSPVPHPGFGADGSASGTFNLVAFDAAERVESVLGQVETTTGKSWLGQQGTIELGPGPLGLSESRRRAMVGKTKAEVAALLGAPDHVRESRAVEVLCYSRSPTSKSYRVRRIGLDEHGVVIERHSYDSTD